MAVGRAHTASGGQQQRVNIGQRRIRRVYPAHPPPSSPASYKPLCQQHAAIRHQLSCQRLVADPPQICMNAAIALSIIPTLAPASEGAPYVGAHDLYQWTRVWMIQWMTDWLDAPTQP